MSGDTAAMEAAGSAAPAPEAEPSHSFSSVDDAVSELGKVREEAAGYRTKYAPFRDAFDGLPDNAIQMVLDAVVGLKSDTTEGVHAWLDLGQNLAKEDEFTAWMEGKGAAPAPVVEDTETEPQEDPVTEPTIDVEAAIARALEAERAVRAEEAQQARVNEQAAQLQAQATELGYQPGSIAYRTLFDTAVANGTGLEEAHSAMQAEFAPSVETVEEVVPEVEPPAVPATGGINPQGGVRTPETVEKLSASDKLAARLDRELDGLPG